ncbi:ADP-ribosylglycohydrolase family protein [Aliterella atlantica]|uniref:ADP-ribosylglycohydrolase n=1 Tax=Aliterella atlantica CENA595 TaxID=1618023 RepID=A0A0D9A0U9_9CYAN|nr:ADP-ribosylglycohydrolase family protein [Aliterella atlantica]KJH73106.1 hypothetical protein UH38_03335 [Aliterella atlantica CENA595]
MRYSLSSQFRGTLLGAMLGEKVSKQVPSQTAKCLIPAMYSLIELGRFEPQHWQEKLSVASISEIAPTIATLPLALFYHENELKLKQNLSASAGIWQNEPIVRESILSVGYATSQVLSKIKPAQLVPHILSLMETPQTELAYKLQQVQELCSQGASLERTLTQVTTKEALTTSIALGFYCFLSSQEDFSLTVKRAQHLQNPLASAIAGALSGAYNSAMSIPSSWQAALTIEQNSAEKEVLQLSDSLVAVWSGVYDYEVHPAELVTKTVVAAPRVIRWR